MLGRFHGSKLKSMLGCNKETREIYAGQTTAYPPFPDHVPAWMRPSPHVTTQADARRRRQRDRKEAKALAATK